MPIHLRTGLPGAAKTLLTIEDVEKLRKESGREVYYYGIQDLNLPWIALEDATKWNDLPPNSIIVIDEAQKVFRPRGNGAPVPPHVEHLETHRHKGYDFYLITQHPMLLDSNVRRLTGRHEHVVRIFGKEKSNVHRWDSVKETCDKSRTDSIKTERDFPKELYGVYKSADAHTIKKAVPLRMYLLLAIPFIILILITFAGYTMWKSSHNDIGKAEKEKMGQVGAYKESDAAPVRPISIDTPAGWFEANAPRVEEMPHTAPKYDEVTKPVLAPIPAACVDFKGHCKCYTQQGTKMSTSEEFCRQVVQNGFFVDWVEPPAQPPIQASASMGDGV